MKNLRLVFALACLLAAALSLRAQPVLDPSHTVVRFAFSTNGVSVGHIDVELFDDEKPETVKNFLLYLYSGGYSNLLLHRLDPGFIMQAGSTRITNGTSTNRIFSVHPVPNYGKIQNESTTGGVFSNTFGTIAAARVFGETNSASTDWFFNLKDNPVLDEQLGGYTVFGRVVNTTGPMNGLNLLDYFKTFRKGTNITTVVAEDPLTVFGEMPIASSVAERGFSIQYRDAFLMDVFVIANGIAVPPDTQAPSVSVEQPNVVVVQTNHATLSGTANDNQSVARVYYDSEFGRFAAGGTSTFSEEVRLRGGTNLIVVRAVDWRGNLSPEVTRRFVYRGLFKPLKLVTNGLGRTIGSITNGQLLEVGQIYKLKARQMPGWFFCGWGGSYSHHKPTIYFFMDEDVTLEANFCYAVSKVAKGSYQGTFAPLTNGPNPSSGWLSLNLSAGGAYSGRLAPLGANYQIRGRFDGFGRSTITGQRGADLLVLSMVILTNEQNRIFGSYTDGKFLSYFTLYPVQKFTRTGPPPVEQGNYTFVISPAGDASVLPAAHGSGTVTIDELGRVTISGELPDGVPIQQTAALLAGGRFAVLDNAGGGNWIVGSAIFSTNRSAFSGDLRWFNPDFPGGTNQSMKLLGSSFVPPPQEPIFDWMNGVVTLSGDALTSPLEVNVTANNDGTFTPAPNAHNLQISVDGSGLLSGSFIHPATQALTPLRGAVLQSSNTAFGLFEGATNGAVSIRAQ